MYGRLVQTRFGSGLAYAGASVTGFVQRVSGRRSVVDPEDTDMFEGRK